MEYSSYEKVVFTITRLSNIQLLKFWLFNFSNFQTTFLKSFMEKLFVLNLHGRVFFFLKFCQMREILKPQFSWYFLYVLFRAILMEMKVLQVGCFQFTVCWICYSIFFDASFNLLSQGLSRNYPFWAQISKIRFKR